MSKKLTVFSIILILTSINHAIAKECRSFYLKQKECSACENYKEVAIDQCFIIGPAFWYRLFDNSIPPEYYINNEYSTTVDTALYSLKVMKNCYSEIIETDRPKPYTLETFQAVFNESGQNFEDNWYFCAPRVAEMVKGNATLPPPPTFEELIKLENDFEAGKITSKQYEEAEANWVCLVEFDLWRACAKLFDYYRPGRVGFKSDR